MHDNLSIHNILHLPDMSSSSNKQKLLSYADAVRTFNSKDVQEDISDACEKLAQAMSSLSKKFESLARQFHTLDLQGTTSPMSPKWQSLRKDFMGLVWQIHTNANFISGRLKMFCSVVLPMTMRKSDGSRRLQEEKLHVLQTYMNISIDQANITRKTVEYALRFNCSLSSFHTEFAKFASTHVVNGQRELSDLSRKITELKEHVQKLCVSNAELSSPDINHLVSLMFRIISTSGRRPSKSKMIHQRFNLQNELTTVGSGYDYLDRKRSEVAHAQYSTQICYSKPDNLTTAQTTLSGLVSEEMLVFESSLSLFLTIWARLRVDCNELLQWIKSTSNHVTPPSVVYSFLESGCTIYTTLANALDACTGAFDPVCLANKT